MGQSQSGFPTASPSGLYPWRGDDSIWRSGEQMYSASHASQTWEYTPKEPSGRHAGVSHSVESASWEHPAGGALASQSSIDFRDSRDVRQPLQQPRPRPPPPPGFERLYPESSHTQAAAAPVRSARGPEPYPFSTLQPREAGGRAGSHFDPFRGGLHAGPDSQPLSPLSHPFPKSSFDPAAIPSSPLLASLADGIWTPNAGATSSSHGFSAGRGGTRMPSLPPPLGSTSGWHQTQRGIAQQGRRQQNDGEDVLDALEEAIEQLRVQSNSEGDNPDGI